MQAPSESGGMQLIPYTFTKGTNIYRTKHTDSNSSQFFLGIFLEIAQRLPPEPTLPLNYVAIAPPPVLKMLGQITPTGAFATAKLWRLVTDLLNSGYSEQYIQNAGSLLNQLCASKSETAWPNFLNILWAIEGVSKQLFPKQLDEARTLFLKYPTLLINLNRNGAVTQDGALTPQNLSDLLVARRNLSDLLAATRKFLCLQPSSSTQSRLSNLLTKISNLHTEFPLETVGELTLKLKMTALLAERALS